MKRIIRVMIIAVVLLIISFFVLKYVSYHLYLKRKTTEMSEYLTQKYSEEMIVTNISYDDILVGECTPAEKPNLKFKIIYWMNQNERFSDSGFFVDTYIQTCLAKESENMIDNVIKNSGISAVCNCEWANDESELLMSKRLYEIYAQKGEMLSWGDSEIPEVHILVNINGENLDKHKAEQLAMNIKMLPPEHLRITIFNGNKKVFEEKSFS